MKPVHSLFAVALIGLAATLPSQTRFQVRARIGQPPAPAVVVDAAIGGQHHAPHHHDPRRSFRRSHGRWELRTERVLIPGYWHDEHVPPTWGWIHDGCGRRHWGIVDPGGCRRVWVPPRYELRTRRVFVAC